MNLPDKKISLFTRVLNMLFSKNKKSAMAEKTIQCIKNDEEIFLFI